MAISDKHGFQYRAAMARIYRAWSATMLEGPETTAEAEIRRGIEIARATGARAHATMHLCLLSDVAMRHGDRDTALAAVAEGLEIAEEQHEECWLAELYRLRGELLLSGPAADQAEAESYFEKALSLSGRQKARLWELRSAVSLACLWRDQGRSVEAIDLLAPVHGWFTEGFETLDLRDAKALLDALA
jgi:predicted ATPase